MHTDVDGAREFTTAGDLETYCQLGGKVELEKNNIITLVQWFDRKAIKFISSYAAVEPADLCKRWSKAESNYLEVERPIVAKEYNSYMEESRFSEHAA